MANFSDAIVPVQNLGGAVSFPVRFQVEEAGQTAVFGTPVMIKAADGGLQAWDGTSLLLIAGILAELQFNNLGSTGSGAPSGFSPILGPGSVIGNYSANPNQPSAVITPPMVPMSDGRIRYWVAAPNSTVFIAKIGNAGSAIATAQTQVGLSFGLTKDTNNFWYVDTSKTAANAVLQIVQLSQLEPVGTVGGHVLFTFLTTASLGVPV
jgi:hypothetical protein